MKSDSLMQTSDAYLLLKLSGTLLRPDYIESVLYPHARLQMYMFLRRAWCHPQVQEARERFAKSEGADSFAEWLGGPGLPPEYAYERFREVITRMLVQKVHTEPLAILLQLLWEEQLRANAIEGVVLPNAVQALQQWNEKHKRFAFYSPENAVLEKLIVQFNEMENIGQLASHHFGSELGSACDAATYRRMAEHLKIPPGQLLYVATDADCLFHAKEAGCKTVCLAAKDAPPGQNGLATIHDLMDIA